MLLQAVPKQDFLTADSTVKVNNAGLQRAKPLAEETDDWEARQQEIAINLEAPVHLSSLLTPHFLKQKEVNQLPWTEGSMHSHSLLLIAW